jgi:hypothetical protein
MRIETFGAKLLTNYARKWGDRKRVYELHPYVRALYGLCILADPHFIIEVGTERGVSTLTFAKAMRDLGRPLHRITTIDADHSMWKETRLVQQELLVQEYIEHSSINTLTMNFMDVEPVVCFDAKVPHLSRHLLYYDIHDRPDLGHCYSHIFLEQWVPRVRNGIVAIDNMHVSPEPAKDYYSPSDARDRFNRHWWGFGECQVIVNWANCQGVYLAPIEDAGMAYFWVSEGVPQ